MATTTTTNDPAAPAVDAAPAAPVTNTVPAADAAPAAPPVDPAPAADTTAAAPAADAAPAAPAEDPPIVNGIIRLRDSNNQLHDYSLSNFGIAEGRAVRALLPPLWQQKIDAQQAFFLNYRRTIDDIPPELREPGAFQKLFDTLSKQGGYISDETSPAVKAFLEGPYGADLRRSNLYKGYKTKEALGTFLETGLAIVAATPEKYFSALTLPIRGLIYAGGVLDDKLSAMPTITSDQALALASAYQGAMYMATESEFAPKETKTTAPGAAGTVGGYLESIWDHVAVYAIAAWNMASGYFSGKGTTWAAALADAENYWTDGKGLKSAAQNAQENAVAKSLDEVRPAVEALLGRQPIAGVDINPYLAVKDGDFVAGTNGVIGTFKGQDNPVVPLVGPDGTTPLRVQSLEEKRLSDLQGGLFTDRTTVGLASSGLGVGAAYGLTYRGIGQGYGNVNADDGFSKLNKQAEAAKKALDKAQAASDAYHGTNGNPGKTTNWRGKPIDAGKLATTLDEAERAYNDFAAKVANHSSAGAVAARKASQQLAANAGFIERYIGHPLTVVGRPFGAGLAHVTNGISGFASGTVTGTAQAISPDHAPRAGGAAAANTAEIINDTAERASTSSLGRAGTALGKWATRLGIGSAFVNPIIGATNSNDSIGVATYSTEGAAIVGSAWYAGGRQLGAKALGVGFSRIVPGLNVGVSTVDLVDGYRTGDAQKQRDAGVSLATQGAGAFIGGAIGSLGFLAGPVGLASAPAGVAIGSSIGGWLSMLTVPAANYFWPAKPLGQPLPAAAPATAEPSGWGAPQPARVAAVVDARQPQLTSAEIMAALQANPELAQQFRMATGRAGAQATFNPQGFARVNTAVGAANAHGNGGWAPIPRS